MPNALFLNIEYFDNYTLNTLVDAPRITNVLYIYTDKIIAINLLIISAMQSANCINYQYN